MGFVPVCKIKFNDEYAPDDWDFELFGRPDVVFMVHNGDDADTIKKKRAKNEYPPIRELLDLAPYIEEYDQANEIIEQLIRK